MGRLHDNIINAFVDNYMKDYIEKIHKKKLKKHILEVPLVSTESQYPQFIDVEAICTDNTKFCFEIKSWTKLVGKGRWRRLVYSPDIGETIRQIKRYRKFRKDAIWIVVIPLNSIDYEKAVKIFENENILTIFFSGEVRTEYDRWDNLRLQILTNPTIEFLVSEQVELSAKISEMEYMKSDLKGELDKLTTKTVNFDLKKNTQKIEELENEWVESQEKLKSFIKKGYDRKVKDLTPNLQDFINSQNLPDFVLEKLKEIVQRIGISPINLISEYLEAFNDPVVSKDPQFSSGKERQRHQYTIAVVWARYVYRPPNKCVTVKFKGKEEKFLSVNDLLDHLEQKKNELEKLKEDYLYAIQSWDENLYEYCYLLKLKIELDDKKLEFNRMRERMEGIKKKSKEIEKEIQKTDLMIQDIKQDWWD